MGIATAELSPIEQTAFLTEYARALDSRWARPILGDTLAHDVVGKIDYDFAGLGVQTSVVCQTALAGEDARRPGTQRSSQRTPTPSSSTSAPGWTAVSTVSRHLPRCTGTASTCPGITALRDQVLPAAPQSHSVPVSLTDERWPDAIPADRPTMLVADGLFAFLTEAQIIAIFSTITDHFGAGELAFNDYGRIGWVSRLAVKLYPQKMFKDVGSQFGYPGFKDAHHPETWNPRMSLVEEASLTDAPEVDLFPGWIRVATKLSGKSKTARRKARILRYAF